MASTVTTSDPLTTDQTRPSLQLNSPTTQIEEVPQTAEPILTQQDHDNDAPATAESSSPPALATRWQRMIKALQVFFGFRGRRRHVRRALVLLVWNLAFGFAQFVGILIILVFANARASPTVPGASQWVACSKPLAVWDIFWIIRTILNTAWCAWSWYRERVIRLRLERMDNTRRSDPEARDVEPSTPEAPPQPTDTESLQPTDAEQPQPTEQPGIEAIVPVLSFDLPFTTAFNLLRYFLVALTTMWWITIWLLEYVSPDQCRHSSPILWWANTGLIILANVIVAFESGLVYYLVLRLSGQAPPPGPPSIPKLSFTEINNIPLVLYIPAPPEPPSSDDAKDAAESDSKSIHEYPPSQPSPNEAAADKHKPLRFWRRKLSVAPARTVDKDKAKGRDPWEAQWEEGEYPFVQLESHRAACAICLDDYEEPRKVRGPDNLDFARNRESSATESSGTAEPQPLRLLNCGHVFHKMCVDLWLMEKSGRCPSCQTPVRPQKKPKKKA